MFPRDIRRRAAILKLPWVCPQVVELTLDDVAGIVVILDVLGICSQRRRPLRYERRVRIDPVFEKKAIARPRLIEQIASVQFSRNLGGRKNRRCNVDVRDETRVCGALQTRGLFDI
ncbi:MAG TPA: hypothetical protein VHJ82_04785 [Actinomycetota bacterium]|nr:hypothetical protein [Actinomycetota bacterium]